MRTVDPTWQLVLPVKNLDGAKSRLQPPGPISRTALARAMVQDTLAAVCSTLPADQVTVVTSDPDAVRQARLRGARVVADPGLGLNAAISAGWAQAAVGPDEGSGRPRSGWAALLGDLPALTPDDLAIALAACARHTRAFVPDAQGTGTVLLASTTSPPEPAFGPGSARHHASTATRLDLDLPRLRQDVDTIADLEAAVRLGVGRHTSRALQAVMGQWGTGQQGTVSRNGPVGNGTPGEPTRGA